MDFDHFLNLCGRSLFAEEYRGDLDAACEELQRAQPDVSTVEAEQLAEYLRCLFVYSILTGRFDEAYKSLSLLHELLDKLSQEWGLRYTNYTLLVDFTRRYPPSLRFYHERGTPVNIAMLGNVIGPNDISSKFMAMVHKYLPLGDPRDQFFCQILGAVPYVPINARNLTAWLHPSFPIDAFRKKNEDPQAVIAETAKYLTMHQVKAETAGTVDIAAYISRLIVELHLASQSTRRLELLTELYEGYEKHSDVVGMANCKMMEGDDLLGPPFASPISLNLIILDPASAEGDDTLWDPVELGLKFEYTTQVKECYESALRLFQYFGCKRGQAAVLLRQGCSLHTVARALDSSDNNRVYLLEEALNKLDQSLALFGRDETNAQIVQAHRVLLDITKGNTIQVQGASRGIGKWAIQSRNESVAHFIGLLMSRFARQEWYKFSRMDTAMASWECAFEVCEAVGDMIPMFQTIVSRALVQHDMFNAPAAQILVERAIATVDRVRTYYDSKIQSASDTPLGEADRQTLLTRKFNTLSSFGGIVKNIYIRLEDLQGFNDWQAKLTGWIEHDDSFRNFIEALDQRQDPDSSANFAFSALKTKKVDIWKIALAEDAAHVKYASSFIKFRRYIDEGDISGAEDALRRFVNETENMEQAGLYRILACAKFGDTVKARAILANISNNQLFQGRLDEFVQGIGVKTSFPDIAANSLSVAILAEDWKRGYEFVALIRRISPGFFEYMDDKSIDFAWRLGNYGAIMLNNQRTEPAFRRLLGVRHMIENRRNQTTDKDARVGSTMLGGTREVFLNLARACLACDESGTPSALIAQYDHGHFDNATWLEHALLFVEECRARAVLDALLIESTHGQKVDDTSTLLSEAVYKRRTLRTLLALKAPRQTQEEEILRLQRDIAELDAAGKVSVASATFIDKVNTIIEPRFLYQNIDENAVVIEAAFDGHGCIAFAVTNHGIQTVYQGPTRFVDMRKSAMKFMHTMKEMTGYVGEDEDTRKRRLAELAAEISSVLLVPFSQTIRNKTHIIFSVSDPLTAFPFAALTFNGKPLMLHAAVSQTPSLTVLHHISQRLPPSAEPTVSIFAKSPTERSLNNGTRDGSNEVNLHMAAIEAVNTARMLATWPIEASSLTRTQFRDHFQGTSSVMHIGTHGDIDHRNPLLSSISIGEDFRVLDMSAIQTRVNLLVFAACLSGLGKATTGSDVLGFSHIVLGTGCQAYMGTLWKVSDFASMILMKIFYRELKDQPQLSLAELLRNAQVLVSQLNGDRVNHLLDEMLEDWTSADVEGNCPVDFVPDAEFLLQLSRMTLDQLDWSSPFFWAPFVLMGHGGFRFSREDCESNSIHLPE